MTRADWIAAFASVLDPQWMDRLPAAVDTALEFGRDWGLDLRSALPGATCSLLFAGFDGSREVVLRLPLAEEEAGPGYRAMHAFAGHGGVAVMREEPALGLTLMPRLRPGTVLDSPELSEDDQISVAASLYMSLHRAEIPDVWTHERWFQELWVFELPAGSPVDPAFLAFGKELGRWLLDTTTRRVLLHGDLHHFNILRDGSDWVAIDPKGVYGDPAFEPVAFLRNPVPRLASDPDLEARQGYRIQRFAELMGEPVERIWGWAVAQIVLDAAWSDSGWSEAWATVAEATLRVRPPEADYLPWPTQ